MMDEYAESGEFLDVLSRGAWAALAEPVTAALAGADLAAGPLVDLGAGSGLGVRLLASLSAEATVWAVEPSAVLRATLLARLMDDPSLAPRVNLIAARAETADLPERIGGVLALNMIGHLRPADRQRLWRRLAERLVPGAPLVVNAQPPARAESVPETEFHSVRIGGHHYVGSGRAEPDGPDAVVWRMRYQVRDLTGRVEREVGAAYRWHVVAPEDLVRELTAAGLPARSGSLDVIRGEKRC